MFKKIEFANFAIGLVLALVVTAGSFLAYSSGKTNIAPEWEMSAQMTFNETFTAQEASVLRRNGRDTLTVLPRSEVALHWNEESHHLDVELHSGRVLFATLADDMQISINTEFARIDSDESMAFVEYAPEGKQLEVFAEIHPTAVTFLADGVELNQLNVPTAHKMKVSAAKVTPTLEKLRLTKLSKEFPLLAYDDDDRSQEMRDALTALKKTYTDSEVQFINQLADNSEFGPAREGLSARLGTILQSFRAAVTIAPHAQSRLDTDFSQESLLYAMSHALYGDPDAANFWLNEWANSLVGQEDLLALRSDLFFVLPGDELFPVKKEAADQLLGSEGPLETLRHSYLEIESLLARAQQVDAELAFKEYQLAFEAVLKSGDLNDVETLNAINREYLLIELLLRQHSIFYDIETIQLLTDLENTILTLAGTRQDLDEEHLAFVQSRIRFLENLFDFVVDRKLSVEEATQLANELLFQAEDYLSSISAEVAVSTYFNQKLDEFDLSVQFINSPEFRSYDDFDTGLDTFRNKATDLDALNEYLQNIRSGSIEEEAALSVEAAVAQVKSTLRDSGIQFTEVLSLGDAELRLFEIQGASAGGFEFESSYDRVTQILFDIESGELRFSTGIQLDAIASVLKQAHRGSNDLDGGPQSRGPDEAPDSGSTVTQDVSLEFAQSQFEAAGLDLEDFDIQLLDLVNNLFTFEGVITSSKLQVSGTYDANSNKVTEVVWINGDGVSRSLPDLALGSLEAAITATYAALQ